jgi:hypothetical protein
LSEQEYVDYIAAADLVCMPYRGMFGTSGVLTHAAHAGKFVLGPEFGTIGELVRRYRLGIACNTEDRYSLERGLRGGISLVRNKEHIKAEGMKEFLRDCAVSTEEFGAIVLRHLTSVGGIDQDVRSYTRG